MDQIKLRTFKGDTPEGYLEVGTLLEALKEIFEPKGLEDKLVSMLPTNTVSKELLTPALIRTLLQKSGVFDFKSPINVSAPVGIEKERLEEGLFYYDIINQRFRVCGPKGWKTVKLE